MFCSAPVAVVPAARTPYAVVRVVTPVPPFDTASVGALVQDVPLDCKKLPDAPVAGKSDVDHAEPV
jgi:hypothetical protein